MNIFLFILHYLKSFWKSNYNCSKIKLTTLYIKSLDYFKKSNKHENLFFLVNNEQRWGMSIWLELNINSSSATRRISRSLIAFTLNNESAIRVGEFPSPECSWHPRIFGYPSATTHAAIDVEGHGRPGVKERLRNSLFWRQVCIYVRVRKINQSPMKCQKRQDTSKYLSNKKYLCLIFNFVFSVSFVREGITFQGWKISQISKVWGKLRKN